METSFAAMGTIATIRIVVGRSRTAEGAAMLRWARCRVHELEQRWSRFHPASEVSRLNAHRGRATQVSADTRLLVRRAITGWVLTSGRFDPTVHDSVVAIGYNRTFAELPPITAGGATLLAAPGCAGISIDDDRGTVTLPERGGFDPGGIGKGLAADLIASELRRAGAEGACVEVGGDVRVCGRGPEDRGWVIAIEHPAPGCGPVPSVWLEDGAVASSSSLKRRWTMADDESHHLVDPRSGRSARGALGATMIARSAWMAEVLATASCIAPAPSGDDSAGSCGFVFTESGSTQLVGNVTDYLA